MDTAGTWATFVEIMTSAHMLKTDIYTYTIYGSKLTWTKTSGRIMDKKLKTSNKRIYLNHKNLNLFEVVLSTSGTGDKQNKQMYFKKF